MRTTLDIPEPLLEEARQLLGFKSKTDTVVVSLRELIRHKRIRAEGDARQDTARHRYSCFATPPAQALVIFVDTSVWIAAFRSQTGAESRHLSRLLDDEAVALAAPVRVEILSGASWRDRARLRSVLSALPLFFPGEATWSRIDRWIDVTTRVGERFGFADLLIGAIAAENGAPIWSLDGDLARMAALKLLDCYRP
jgi:predicted nucleic acid-binding protein